MILPALKAAPLIESAPIIAVNDMSKINQILLDRFQPIHIRPLSVAELRKVVDFDLTKSGLSVEEFLTEEAWDRLIENGYTGSVRKMIGQVRSLIPYYSGQPITLDEVRFYLEGQPLPEKPTTPEEAAAQIQVLKNLRKQFLSSCAYLLSYPRKP